ncbi:pentatricopeptide repeat-containing protein 2, mitochondrial-like [Lineus longissimus]|uniref:pentatricopeptide repeat-containing protein 2, mitochondrial-like n=1 Tax=Lineus longissimus TaxID=88925 RepID=UPI002B4CE030
MAHVFRRSCIFKKNIGSFTEFLWTYSPISATVGRRFLFSDEFLGLESYRRQRVVTLEKTGSSKAEFSSMLKRSMEKTNIVFTDDLKTMVFQAESDEDLKTTIEMIKSYAQQTRHSYSTFSFGPVVMRMFYYLKRPDLALDCFKDEHLENFFDQRSSHLVLLDMLLVSGHYSDLLDVYSSVKAKYLGTDKYPNDCTTLALAALYKVNTPEAFKTALELLQELGEHSSVVVPARALAFAAYFALGQGKPDVCLEILESQNEEKFVACLNMKAMAKADLDLVEEAIALITSLLYKDIPDYIKIRQEIFPETVEKITKAVERRNKSEVTHKFQIVLKDLERRQHLTFQTFEDFIFEPIVRKLAMKGGFKYRQRGNMQRQADYINSLTPRKRVGLSDLE